MKLKEHKNFKRLSIVEQIQYWDYMCWCQKTTTDKQRKSEKNFLDADPSSADKTANSPSWCP